MYFGDMVMKRGQNSVIKKHVLKWAVGLLGWINGVELEMTNDTNRELPRLRPNNRNREFKKYPDDLKARVLYEHLIKGNTHRWLDMNVLGKNGNTKGRDSANILYYLGMKADYRGFFEDKNTAEVISILGDDDQDFRIAIELLKKVQDSQRLEQVVNLDIASEDVQEGRFVDGGVKYRYIKSYERNPRNRLLAIKEHGVICKACGFDFEAVYGERGKEYIEIHHIQQLSGLEEPAEINPRTDLIPLCANCHRMIHRKKDEVLTVEQLIEILERRRH